MSYLEIRYCIHMYSSECVKFSRYHFLKSTLTLKFSQVGACIVNGDNKIVSIGYNGMPRGCNDDLLPWGKGSSDPLKNKYMYGELYRFEMSLLLKDLTAVRCLQSVFYNGIVNFSTVYRTVYRSLIDKKWA